MDFWRKYGVQAVIEFPVIKRAVQDFAISTDWTPAAADCKISKDGGNVANTTNAVAAVGGTGSALWSLTLTATEMQAARITVQIVDAATKVIEDQALIVTTYGHASATHTGDINNLDAAVTSRLAPTVAARTLDVSGTGEAGIDLANVGSPTTALNLSGTTIKAVTDDVGITQSAADKVWGTTVRTLTSFGTLVADIWTYSTRTLSTFSTALAVSVWDVLAASVAAANSIGLQIKTNLDAAISSRSTVTTAQVNAECDTAISDAALATAAAVAALNDLSVADVEAASETGAGAALATYDPPTDAEMLAAIGPLATGAAVAAVQADTDDIQTRLPTALVGGRMNSSVGAVANAAIGAAAFATGAFDAIFTRALSAVEGSAPARCLAWAIAKLVNKVDVSGGTLSVKQTDDATEVFNQTVTTDAAADPITSLDTN